MSGTLKLAAETVKTAAESTASTLSDLVDEAKTRIEESSLPMPTSAKRRRSRRNSKPMVLIALVAAGVATAVACRLMQGRRAKSTSIGGTYPDRDRAAQRDDRASSGSPVDSAGSSGGASGATKAPNGAHATAPS